MYVSFAIDKTSTLLWPFQMPHPLLHKFALSYQVVDIWGVGGGGGGGGWGGGWGWE